MLLTSVGSVLALACLLPLSAQAAGSATSHAAAPHATAASSSPVKVSMKLANVFRVNGHVVGVPHRITTVNGRVKPFVKGQWVLIRFHYKGKVFKTQHLRVKPMPNGRAGRFTTRYGAPGVGRVKITVSHAATKGQAAFSTKFTYRILNEHVGPGSRGMFVRLVQNRLAHLHFYVIKSGRYDLQTELAVNAYHRLLGRGTAITLDPRTRTDLLNGVGKFKVRFPHHGRHAEGDLTHQLLALVAGRQVKMIFPISSGKPSTPTILGSFKIYYRVPGYLPDGMYYSDFFIRGYAIHGYNPAPDYPASHGCMRLPISDAITVFNWLALGDWVDTYYR